MLIIAGVVESKIKLVYNELLKFKVEFLPEIFTASLRCTGLMYSICTGAAVRCKGSVSVKVPVQHKSNVRFTSTVSRHAETPEFWIPEYQLDFILI